MSDMQVDVQSMQKIGKEWIQVLVEKDFQRLARICQPEVHSRLMTPRHYDSFENVTDLITKVEGWFGECSSFQEEQKRIALVGEKLGIFYRLSFEKNGEPYTAEQQVYCFLRDGRIDQLNLLCSGFQPARGLNDAPLGEAVTSTAPGQPAAAQLPVKADAFLDFKSDGAQGPTCSILTPSIRRKLIEMRSGQVLEVQVDDPAAKGDIEAWCRLSGNQLLSVSQEASPELHFFLVKK
jgi:TusA-related sulfurtransferase